MLIRKVISIRSIKVCGAALAIGLLLSGCATHRSYGKSEGCCMKREAAAQKSCGQKGGECGCKAGTCGSGKSAGECGCGSECKCGSGCSC
jgi:hypothetical protein